MARRGELNPGLHGSNRPESYTNSIHNYVPFHKDYHYKVSTAVDMDEKLTSPYLSILLQLGWISSRFFGKRWLVLPSWNEAD